MGEKKGRGERREGGRERGERREGGRERGREERGRKKGRRKGRGGRGEWEMREGKRGRKRKGKGNKPIEWPNKTTGLSPFKAYKVSILCFISEKKPSLSSNFRGGILQS